MTNSILVVDDEETARMVISNYLRTKGYEVIEAGTLADARKVIADGKADVIILDVQLPDGYGPHLLEDVATLPMRPQVIIITAHGEVGMAVDAMKAGAQDFIEKPLDLIKLEAAVKRANDMISMRRELNHWRASQGKNVQFIIGTSPEMAHVVELARRASEMGVSALITGPTGTGKEVLARFIHQSGPRANKPFIDINCPAIQPTM
ncbi:MAG TPA: response regulator, partial [Anaerolineaceae bacterium]|nr:response regulator [Anaerolineaceae bacterium]